MHPLISAFIPTAKLVASSLGGACEVVLHDITTPQNSVVFVAGDVTGRRVGQSFDHLVTQVILSKDFKDDFRANYYFTASNGKRIKSSTSLIRDEKGDVVGAFCVNIDVGLIGEAFKFLNAFLPGFDGEQEDKSEQTDDIMQILQNLIDKIIGESDAATLKKDEKKELVEFMEKKGVFSVKGAIDMVANRLKVSRVTIYSYLDEIKKRG